MFYCNTREKTVFFSHQKRRVAVCFEDKGTFYLIANLALFLHDVVSQVKRVPLGQPKTKLGSRDQLESIIFPLALSSAVICKSFDETLIGD